jgi:hypothetical protein
MGTDVGNLDALCLELPAETGTMESSTCRLIKMNLLDRVVGALPRTAASSAFTFRAILSLGECRQNRYQRLWTILTLQLPP